MDHSRNIINENFLQPSREGLISQDNILTYQAHIDDLLLAARFVYLYVHLCKHCPTNKQNNYRSSNPAQVIHVMKNIVTVCRSITEEIESQENTLFTDTKNALYELKERFSVSLSDLLVAAKYHASGMGISPVSLLDRSAGHLTSVIVELVKLLGMNGNKSAAPAPPANKGRSENNNHSYYGSIISGNKANHHKSTASSVMSDNDSMKSPPMMRSQLENIGYKYNNGNNDNMYSSAKKHQSQKSNSNSPIDLTPEELVVSCASI